jgi:O-antigen ligase
VSDRTNNVSIKEWFPYIELMCAALAGALWYLFPTIGPGPLLLILAAWIGRIALYGSLAPLTTFEIPLLLFLITAAVSVWSAYNQEVASGKFWLIVGSVALFYAFVRLLLSNRTGAVEESIFLMVIFGVVVSVYFILTNDWSAYPTKFLFIRSLGQSLQPAGLEIPGHRLHPNVAGGMIAMTIPFAVTAYLIAKSNRHRYRSLAAVIAILVTAVGLLLSSSRSAWLSLGVAAIVVLLFHFLNSVSGKSGVQRVWLFAGMGLLILTLLGVLISTPSIRADLLDLIPVTPSGISRVSLIRDGLALANDYPFIGAGFGGYIMLYSTYSIMLHVGFEVHTHNIFLNVSIQQGLLALGSLLWIWLSVAFAVWNSVIQENDELVEDTSLKFKIPEWRLILYTGAISLLIILVHGLVDDTLYGSRGVLLLFVPVAFTIPTIISQPKPSAKKRRDRAMILVGLLILIGVLFWRPIFSLAHSNLASVKQSKKELSVYEWPDWPIQDAVRNEVDLSEAIAGFEKALSINPQNGSAAKRLGQIELSIAEYEDALDHLKLAYSATPWDNATRQLLGEAYLVNGFVEEGRSLWESVNNGQDQFKAREFWYMYIEDEMRADWIREGAQ